MHTRKKDESRSIMVKEKGLKNQSISVKVSENPLNCSMNSFNLAQPNQVGEVAQVIEINYWQVKGSFEPWHEEVGTLLAKRYSIAGWTRSLYINDWQILRDVCGSKHPKDVFLLDLEAKVLQARTQATRQNYVARIQSLFTSLRYLNLIPLEHHPDKGLPKVKVASPSPRPITKEQAIMLMTEAKEPMREWFMFACLAGLRAMEIATIRGDWLELHEQGYMLRVFGKSKTEKLIPAHPKLVEIIQKKNVLGPLYDMKPRYLSIAACKEMRRLGIVTKVRTVSPDNPSRLSLHSCRHFFATQVLAASGNSLVLTSRVMRHSGLAMTLRYADIVNGEEAKVVGGLMSDIDWTARKKIS